MYADKYIRWELLVIQSKEKLKQTQSVLLSSVSGNSVANFRLS